MLWMWLAGISLVGLAVYLWYMWLFARGLRLDAAQPITERPFVSVVIAARNEEENLPHLLTALVNQSYPQSLYEVIIADDESTDNTAAVIERFSSKWSCIKRMAVTGRQEAVSPKKNALTQAITASKGEIIMLTDADCVVGKYWIESMLSYYRDDVDMVCGFSTPQTGSWKTASLVHKYEYFDVVAMFSAAAGAINRGKYFSCTGQNLSYRRCAWDDVGGFEPIKHLVSGDDVNLMQLFRKAGKRICFACNYHSFAVTQPISGWNGLFNQRSRWASNMKWQWNLNPEFYAYLVSVLIVTYLPWMLLFWQPLLAAGILAAKWAAEYRFLHQAVCRFKVEPQRLRFYPLWVLIQPWYMIIVAFGGAVDAFRWKH
jgi:cellulose synthase/poly-beta-1,6-N-acetylglucosamine synthase-like glycosyltransferase